jgi:hypothetical protein
MFHNYVWQFVSVHSLYTLCPLMYIILNFLYNWVNLKFRLSGCFVWDLQIFKIPPWEITSLSTGNSGGRVATFSPPDELVVLGYFLQST